MSSFYLFFSLTLDFEECWSSSIANFVFAHAKKSSTVLFTNSANGDVGDSDQRDLHRDKRGHNESGGIIGHNESGEKYKT